MKNFILGLVMLLTSSLAFGALQKDTETSFGVNGNYFYVTQFSKNTVAETCNAVLSLYASKAAFDAGNQPLVYAYASRTWSGSDCPLDVANVDATAAAVTDGKYYQAMFIGVYQKFMTEIPWLNDATVVE